MIKASSRNIFDVFHESSDNEIFTDLLKQDNIHIEKIISYGQTTPLDKPYIQDHDE